MSTVCEDLHKMKSTYSGDKKDSYSQDKNELIIENFNQISHDESSNG